MQIKRGSFRRVPPGCARRGTISREAKVIAFAARKVSGDAMFSAKNVLGIFLAKNLLPRLKSATSYYGVEVTASVQVF